MMILGRAGALVSTPARLLLNESTSRYVHKKIWPGYNDRYPGKFDYHNRENYPRRMSPYKEEELLDEIHSIRNKVIDEPSPFHVIRRTKSISQCGWAQKVTLRRLNLHSSFNGECSIVPNTPQYNSLINKVKHMVTLKPARFADGRIPTEKDIGAIKVCPYTGNVYIDEKLRLLEKRVNTEKPTLFQGNHLRHHLGLEVGLNHPFSSKPPAA